MQLHVLSPSEGYTCGTNTMHTLKLVLLGLVIVVNQVLFECDRPLLPTEHGGEDHIYPWRFNKSHTYEVKMSV